MKIILLRDKGQARAIRLSRQTAVGLGLALLAAICLSSYYLVDRLGRKYAIVVASKLSLL